MQYYHAILGALALAALLLSWRLPRCGKWIFLVSASYVASVLYHRLVPYDDVMPHGAVISFFCDAFVFVMIRQMHQEKWEIYGLGTIVMFMAVFNLIQVLAVTFGFPPVMANEKYSTILEVANALYLFIIGGVGLSDLVARNERHGMGHYRHGGVSATLASAVEAGREKSHVRKLRY